MLAKIYSAAVYGVDAYEVEIEVNAGAGDPKMVIVGLPDAAVKESKDRVRTAIANSPSSAKPISIRFIFLFHQHKQFQALGIGLRRER